MQQLQNASDVQKCARGVLEAVLAVLVHVRESAALRHRDRPSLIHLRAMGVLRKRPGATLSAVADQLALTISATSRLVDALVAKGVVARTVPPGNRRTVSLLLTPAGTRALEAAMRETQRDLAKPLKRLTAQQRCGMCASMEVLQELIEGNSTGQPTRGKVTKTLRKNGQR